MVGCHHTPRQNETETIDTPPPLNTTIPHNHGKQEEEEERRGVRTSTQPRTWVMPCRCPALVHRRCLEALVLGQGEGEEGKGGGGGLLGWWPWLLPGGNYNNVARGWISYDSAMERGVR